MKKIIVAAAILMVAVSGHARAQTASAVVVSSCGTPPITYTAGQSYSITQDTNGLQCGSASVVPSGTQDVNLKQVNGATVNVGAGTSGAGTQRITTSTDSTIGTVTSITNPVTVAQPTAANLNATVVTPSADACQAVAHTYTSISITTATTTRIVAPASAKRTYICQLLLTSAAADNIGIVEGTGGTCGAATAGVIGGTTAANGLNFSANGGVSLGTGGYAIAATAGTNVDLCLITSAATPLAGVLTWVQAP